METGNPLNNESFSEPIEDFDGLANWFVALGSHFSPAECHGALIGALSGGMRLSDAEWLGFIGAVIGLDAEKLASLAAPETAQPARRFAIEQLKLLTDNDLNFGLFLPDDENGIRQRTESLGGWCKGFLGGFAEAHLHRRQLGQSLPEKYPENVEEGIRDLTEIAKATYAHPQESADDLDSEVQQFDPLMSSDDSFDDAQGSEVEEKDYFEVCEYVRLAASTIFTEFGWVEALENHSSGSANSGANNPPVVH